MVKATTSMDAAGYNIGRSMLEVLAGKFHQDFALVEQEGAQGAVNDFIDDISDQTDLLLLKGDIENLLGFETENDMRKYFHLVGASYWPLKESVKEVFSKALERIDERVA